MKFVNGSEITLNFYRMILSNGSKINYIFDKI